VVTDVLDTNGAGDGFFAGFATSWMQGEDLESAMRSGARQGALAVASSGLAPIA
jgi:sugar/nucleoside kinase (ribokinase family)